MLLHMTEIMNQKIFEDSVAVTTSFLESERGVGIDGAEAAQAVAEQVLSVGERAQALLQDIPYPGMEGMYVPLSKHNATSYSEAVAVLPGHMVLVPSALVDGGRPVLFPAVVSEDGIKTGTLRLHVYTKEPYRQQLRPEASVVLSAAGQSETRGVGDHGKKASDGVEAEHFATLLAAGSDANVQRAWKDGYHVNHMWRDNPTSSVTTQASRRLFGGEIPQSTITITRQDIEAGKAQLLWHEGMRDSQTGQPETATRPNALVVIQGLGFQALRQNNPKGLDAVKELIA